jgi:hypothetical protein
MDLSQIHKHTFASVVHIKQIFMRRIHAKGQQTYVVLPLNYAVFCDNNNTPALLSLVGQMGVISPDEHT